MSDRRALQILFDTYWSSAGWRGKPSTPPEDYDYAKRAGILFDPVRLTHDQILARALAARVSVSQAQAAAAFLSSLSSSRPELRSAVSSWALLRRLKRHSYTPSAPDRPRSACATCGLYAEQNVDFNVLNFERYKWGGVRHDAIQYAAFDLEQLKTADAPAPSAEDRAVLDRLLTIAEKGSPADTVVRLVERLTHEKVPRGTKPERAVLVDILGICGVLPVRGRPDYLHAFTRWADREEPPQRFVERAYPVCWWRGSDGVNRRVAASLFGTPDAIRSSFGHARERK